MTFLKSSIVFLNILGTSVGFDPPLPWPWGCSFKKKIACNVSLIRIYQKSTCIKLGWIVNCTPSSSPQMRWLKKLLLWLYSKKIALLFVMYFLEYTIYIFHLQICFSVFRCKLSFKWVHLKPSSDHESFNQLFKKTKNLSYVFLYLIGEKFLWFVYCHFFKLWS
jgi:hypothetical protein